MKGQFHPKVFAVSISKAALAAFGIYFLTKMNYWICLAIVAGAMLLNRLVAESGDNLSGGFNRPIRHDLKPREAAFIVEQFLAGTGGRWDWDDFISVKLDDPLLEKIRIRCAGLPSEFPPGKKGHYCGEQGVLVLKEIALELKKYRK